jgi:hypothetical protein
LQDNQTENGAEVTHYPPTSNLVTKRPIQDPTSSILKKRPRFRVRFAEPLVNSSRGEM